MSRRLTENQIAQIIHDFSDSESEGIEDTAQENILEEVEDTSSNSFTVKPVQMEQNSTTSISYSTAQHHRRAHRLTLGIGKVHALIPSCFMDEADELAFAREAQEILK
ncbi:hypothetical protein EVAR_97062_1 [Eumeta japonica]|uniref:Uncharacterized protein n=1 Tax=Eumeta variegata TaxID=151549 RepID=A0A4C2ABI4_EUMVA|nr:hypothetical protein EVAR_97062_1 [Eumeta japonica]